MEQDIFDQLGVEVPIAPALPNVNKARMLVQGLEVWWYSWDHSQFEAQLDRLEEAFRKAGGHSVARAIRWGRRSHLLETRGFEDIEVVVMRAARSWLQRVEVSAIIGRRPR